MPLAFSVLASGSSGNCTLLRLEGERGPRHVLIDAGLSPRRTQQRVESLGIELEEIGDIVLTHLDADHLAPGWVRAAPALEIAVHVHRRHARRAIRAGVPVPALHPFEERFRLGARTSVQGTLLAHDQLGSVAYVVEHESVRLGFATDLGRVPRSLLGCFVRLDALALESNYDGALQRQSDRPGFLKRRIMGGLGHLSNDQALEAVLQIASRSRLHHLVLLHLSQECNSPELVRRLYDRAAPHLVDLLTISDPTRPTPLLEVRPAATTLWG
jgi:phosphoribosyl 1,2-cyclic phosphodiesterase